MPQIPNVDANTLWWTLRETLRELRDTKQESDRIRAIELLQLLAEWLKMGGTPPEV